MKQTTIYLGMMVLLGFMSSCNRTPLDEQQKLQSDQIMFAPKAVIENIDTEHEEWTKGKPLNNLVDILPSMAMFCYVTDDVWDTDGSKAKPSKMNNTPLYSSKNADGNVVWSYKEGDEKTWEGVPYSANVTFFGYSPVATADNGLSISPDFLTSEEGVPTVHYEVLDDIPNQPDLHIAVPVKDMMRTVNPVQLNYRRALADIGIIIFGSGQKVNGAYVTGLSRSGDIRLDVSPVATDKLVWKNLGEPSTAAANNLRIPMPKPAPFEVGSYEYGPRLMLTDQKNGYLMMIPQKLTDSARLVVELEGEPNRAYKFKTSEISEWIPGHMFQYRFNLQESSITVEPSDWMDVLATASSIEVTVKGVDKNSHGWEATIEGEGLTVSPMKENFGVSTKVTISWSENAGYVNPGTRFATVTFKPQPTTGTPYYDYGEAEFHTSQLGKGPMWIEYNGVKWAVGNLIADGAHGCKLGSPTDGGLYFQFGSLVGIKGGINGDGRGRVNTDWYMKMWDGVANPNYIADNEIAVLPKEMLEAGGLGKPTLYYDNKVVPDAGVNTWWFNHKAYPYGDNSLSNPENFRNFPGIKEGSFAKVGSGDPCTYYLGKDWELPTFDNWHSLCNYVEDYPWKDIAMVGAKLKTIDGSDNLLLGNEMINIPVAGYRASYTGMISGILASPNAASLVHYWSVEVRGASNGCAFTYNYRNGIDLYSAQRTEASPVRCVYNK